MNKDAISGYEELAAARAELAAARVRAIHELRQLIAVLEVAVKALESAKPFPVGRNGYASRVRVLDAAGDFLSDGPKHIKDIMEYAYSAGWRGSGDARRDYANIHMQLSMQFKKLGKGVFGLHEARAS